MTWLLAFLVAVFVADIVRLRARLASLPVAPDAAGTDTGGYQLVTARGVTVTAAAYQSAVAWAQLQGLEVLDLVPGDLPAASALPLAAVVDPRSYRYRRFATGRTAGHALIVARDVWDRAECVMPDAVDDAALVRLAARLKRYACTTTGIVVVPALRSRPETAAGRYAALRETLQAATVAALVIEAVMLALLVAGVLLPVTRPWGLAAVIVYHLQPLLIVRGTAIKSRDVWLLAAFRLPLQMATWLRTVAAMRSERRRAVSPAHSSHARAEYEQLNSRTDHYFQPRLDACPLCNRRDLRVHLTSGDLMQRKPGRFTLERCANCGHVFQNPQLSPEGLRYYYRDFYDGLNEGLAAWMFERTDRLYLGRARMPDAGPPPRRWLDVGGGYGHFCCVARQVWPTTAFDALDMSEAVERAIRRRWVDRGYRGFFADVAPLAANQYDMVSMSHYLEHTPDPRAELAAARTALAPGGRLLIEVPDPESIFARLLGRYWIGYLQPQHLHLLSRGNLAALLEAHGFKPVRWQRGEAHNSGDFSFALAMLVMRVAPPEWPWHPRASRWQRAWRVVAWTVAAPVLGLAFAVDEALVMLVRRGGASNAYRVLAIRVD